MYEPKQNDRREIVCFYHKNCLDGVGAAHVVKNYFYTGAVPRAVECIPAAYGELPEGLDLYRDTLIFIVDFSFKREVLQKLMQYNEVILLDHHASAAKDLEGLFELDQSHSGAILAWKFFYGNEPAPVQYLHIEDRDLWKFDMPFTKEYTAAAFSYPLTLEGFEQAFSVHPNEMVRMGTRFLEKHDTDVALIAKNARRMTLNGHDVPVVNCNYQFASAIGESLNEGEAFSVSYSDTQTSRQFSLRSRKGEPGAVDVSVIAHRFGGGGHVNAAGFTLSYDDPRFGRSHIELSAG